MSEVLTGGLDELMQLGLYTGMGDIYIAPMTTEDTASAPPVYGTPVVAAEGVSFGITPEFAQGTKTASDRTIRKASVVTGYTVRMEFARMLASVRSYVLGYLRDSKGGEVIGNGMPPLVAVGYAAHRDNDSPPHLRWLYKCRFSEQTISDKTAQEGAIDYGTPVLEAQAIPLACGVTLGGRTTHPLRYDADLADEACKWTEEAFFAAVPLPQTDGGA